MLGPRGSNAFNVRFKYLRTICSEKRCERFFFCIDFSIKVSRHRYCLVYVHIWMQNILYSTIITITAVASHVLYTPTRIRSTTVKLCIHITIKCVFRAKRLNSHSDRECSKNTWGQRNRFQGVLLWQRRSATWTGRRDGWCYYYIPMYIILDRRGDFCNGRKKKLYYSPKMTVNRQTDGTAVLLVTTIRELTNLLVSPVDYHNVLWL